MEGRERLRDEDEGASGGGSAAAAAGAASGAPSREELLALLAARDAQLAAVEAERDVQLAARDVQLAAAKAAGDAAVATAEAERDAARVGAEAERAFARSLLARDATLAAALAERDEGRRLMAQPSVRAALLGERLIDVIGIVAAVGYACEVSHCLFLCGETWRKGDKGATNDMIARSLERQCGASAARAAKRDGLGWAQLMRAAQENNLPRVLQLVQLGAPLELRDDGGNTALHIACSRGHDRIAKALLDGKYEGRGALIDACDSHRMTPLMRASWRGKLDVVRLLLARGARQELRDCDGWTALYCAARDGSSEIASLLCDAPGGAAVLSLRSNGGETPLDIAERGGFLACAAMLRALGAKRGADL